MKNNLIKMFMAAGLITGVFIASFILPLSLSESSDYDETDKNGGHSDQDVQHYVKGEEQINIDFTEKIVVVDSGHGGIDPGKTSSDGTKEKDINLDIAKKLKDKLIANGINVVMTRESDTGLYSESDTNKKRVDMSARCRIINKADADVIVSIHQNSYISAQAKGAQVFYYKGSEKGKKLASILQKHFKESVDNTNKRVEKSDSSYYILLNTNVPAVIVECGFLSNPQELAKLKSDEYKEKIADALCAGIMEYLEEEMTWKQ